MPNILKKLKPLLILGDILLFWGIILFILMAKAFSWF